MHALQLTADWQPKPTYALTAPEKQTRKVKSGSSVWRQPKLTFTTLADPEPLPHEVIIEVAFVGICGSDMHMYETDAEGYMLYPGLTRFPNVIGHEFSGKVVACGQEVTDLRPGDLVTAEEVHWCGRCDACRKGLVNHCQAIEELGFTTPGAMAQYIAVNAKHCWRITELAERLGDERQALRLAALVEPTGVSYHAMFNRLTTWKPGYDCAVFGGGPIGLTAVALAKAAGASQVIVFDISPARLDMAKRVGATHVHNPSELHDFNDVLLEHTYGRGVDFVVEAAGAPAHTLTPLRHGLAVGATIAHIGRSEKPTALPLEDYQVRGVQLLGSLGHSGHGTFPHVIRLMAAGAIDLRPIISDVIPLGDAIKAFKRLESRRDAKILLEP